MNNTIVKDMTEEEALEKVKADAINADITFKLRFKKPFMYDGVEYQELNFDLENLTGRDSLDVERELAMRGIQAPVLAFSGEYIIRIAAKACLEHIGSDAFEHMPMKEYSKVRNKIRNFLMSSEL
ncbi:MAG: hypothetical protein IKF99_12025 [Oscillospiraceae bacterium]|nr:hypothetical protein [Oscillospiraceae bacterium]